MQLKVISEEFEEVASKGLPYVTVRIRVLVDDEVLVAESRHLPESIRSVPSEVLIGALRNKVMVVIEQKLFNDYNTRTIH